ncbi:MAG TPA: adenylosuccinate lyase [Candidatus Sumerlaeota bacterium]|nr:adenylosuccinate lyase [Candidatus Sumerlaeota bacterium]HON49890.1 adenylosuccinate lyase [Candidatus Sumerlaeota bacterium]HOR63862.1 adenylosuccinate lyase [Candidatus Sumerlaeota bacterium]HPL74386.1 adenylosuccinate lyase [Candidatus Sumerlaeota bacterium]HRU55148.1 adenylosuccinate lyase [Candidatus Sumerlaeia bacterium]
MLERYTLPEMKELWSEESKFGAWLEVEILVCEAWAQAGKIPPEALEIIKRKAAFSVERIQELERDLRHDVIAFTASLAENIGPESRFVHMGLTSSDVVDTALSILLVRAGRLILAAINDLIPSLEKRALENRRTVIMGRTHGIHAEPTSLGLKFLLWREEMLRNKKRMEQAIESVRVGKISGAVGTYAHTGLFIEKYVCEKLGLKPSPISTQVLQRDRHAEFLSAIAIIGASIEKIACEVRGLQRTEIREMEEPFGKKQKGSSAMPHKRNPVVCEQLCGLARVLRSNLMSALENIALWHERDISHSSVERIILPDSTSLAHYMLKKIKWVIDGMEIYPDAVAANLEKTQGLLFSQKIMLGLVEKGLTREEAYAIVQRNAMKTWQEKKPLRENLLSDAEFSAVMSASELDALMDFGSFLIYVDEIYKNCGLDVSEK